MVAKLIFYYIIWTIKLKIPPWWYFQLNAKYFNAKKWIYSKIDINKEIPNKWRLCQYYLKKNEPPNIYPVFLKPEWGQNGNGIKLVHSLTEFNAICMQLSQHKKRAFIVQEIAIEKKEFEIFYIRSADDKKDYVALTITEVVNHYEPHPINTIHNKHTNYHDCTHLLSKADILAIKGHLQKLPDFRLARVGVKTNSIEDLVCGVFKIIEINLFTPMPLNLLDDAISKADKIHFIKQSMYDLARISSNISKQHFKRFLFLKKVIRHYQVK